MTANEELDGWLVNQFRRVAQADSQPKTKLVSPYRWRFWMGDMPMPEGCTNEQMWAMYDAVQKIEYREYAAGQFTFYQQLKEKWKALCDHAKKYRDTHPNFEEDYQRRKPIVDLIDEQIKFWRGELVE